MNKDFHIELTKNLYRLTLLFPKKEPLRYKMRELADEILADLVGSLTEECLPLDKEKTAETGPLRSLEVLDSFFEVAKAQNWVKPDDVLAIQKEYANLRGELERFRAGNSLVEATVPLIPVVAAAAATPAQIAPSEPKGNFVLLDNERINERQEKIMAFLREQGRAQVWQVKQILPEVTKRTLRRDFDCLLKKGVIERIGERNNTSYQLKTVQV